MDNLYRKTQTLMRNTSLSPGRIAKQIPDLKERWIYLFRDQSLDDYGVKKVQTLHDFLARQ